MSDGWFDAGDPGEDVEIEVKSTTVDLNAAVTARLAVRKVGRPVTDTYELDLAIITKTSTLLLTRHTTDEQSFTEDGRYLGQIELLDALNVRLWRTAEFPLPLVGKNEVAPLPPLPPP